jgi:hypothetical protein
LALLPDQTLDHWSNISVGTIYLLYGQSGPILLKTILSQTNPHFSNLEPFCFTHGTLVDPYAYLKATS